MDMQKIHEDERGSIHVITGFEDTPEVTLFYTKEGYARGGCIHKDSDEHCVVIEGLILYRIGNALHRLHVGQTICIPKGTPHYFIAKSNCVVEEWGATVAEKKDKHPEFRAIVDGFNVDRRKYETDTPIRSDI